MSIICKNINCKKEFMFYSLLKKHLQNSYHCSKNIDNINSYILELKNNTTNVQQQIKEDIKCNNCNITYTRQSSLNRHLKTNRCQPVIFNENERSKEIENLKKQLEILKSKIIQAIQPQVIQPQIIQPQVIQPPNQIINNNSNNSSLIINNNITIIQHINPSGFETLPLNLSNHEMLRLLNLGDKGVIEIVKLVCEQDENKNFFKINMNKNNISYLNNNYKIDICQDKELKDKLLKQCVILTYKMLIICSPIMTSEQIYNINSNLQNISQKMKEEIFDNGLKNIIEYELRNNSKLIKDKITKYSNQINNNPEIKEQAQINYGKALEIKQETNKHKKPSITLYEINQKLGDPLTLPELSTEFTYNDFNNKHFEYTTYCNYWNKRIIDEKDFINSHENKTISDITCFENRKKNIINKLKEMETINHKIKDVDENNNIICDIDSFSVGIAIDYINGW